MILYVIIGAIIISVIAYIYIDRKKEPKVFKLPEEFRASANKGNVYIPELKSELSPKGQKLWKHLLSIHMGNKQKARDFVLYEKKFNKDGQIEELIQEAIDRWVKDNK